MKKWTVPAFAAEKGKSKLGCCTAYDACFAKLADEAGVPCILVGDSMGMVALGYGTTLPVTMDEMLSATAAVARAVKDALVVCDLPFGAYQCGDDAALANAIRALQAGSDAVKLEGGAFRAPLVQRLVENGIPVVAHVGLMPQSVNALGGFKMQGKTAAAATQLKNDVAALEAAGAFAVTLECVPDALAKEITETSAMSTIGIGAGPHCDVQWLVMHDLLGLNTGRVPSFARKFADLGTLARKGFADYVAAVASSAFPAERN
ncbi:MAG: 3-methyl-2-oxobutanoate hydroxymethyltransferase [Kiritimatiellae bacterium]|nr:3-methyl-2-oxobutanoate hydroxymethyltransferase [Kiritimatiellia bacterium]